MNINEQANFIWSIADLLRGDFKQSEYGKVILPFTVLRRFDCVLAPSKAKILEANKTLTVSNKRPIFKRMTGHDYYNVSQFDFEKLMDDSNAIGLIAQQDLVLDGCDNFSTRYLVNRVCVQHQVALISASAIGFQGQLFMVEGDSACYECLFPKEDQANESLRCADSGVLATTPNVMASLQAHHTLIYLGLGIAALKQKLLLWDGLSLKQRLLAFEKDRNCPCCQAR